MPKLPTLDPWAARGYKVLDSNKLPVLLTTYRAKKDNGRTLTLDGVKWRKLRASILQGEPLCRHCISRGLSVPATDVDHRDNDPSNNELVNLIPMCHSCHSRKTQRDMGHNVSMGCDTDGTPLDASHHWNKSPATDGHKPTCETFFIANREASHENDA